MHWRVLCDFDGTIAIEDVTDSLLERFAEDGWEQIEADWKAGRIGSRECMARQVELIHASQAELDDHLDGIAIDPAFPSFVARCQAKNVPLTVVSDGLDYAIRRILERHGLSDVPIIANRLERTGWERYRLTFPYANAACAKASGTCKCKVAEACSPAMSLLIGDGTSDMCAAGSVDLVFAKDKLLTYCRDEGLPVVAFDHFGQATLLLDTLLDEPLRLGIAALG